MRALIRVGLALLLLSLWCAAGIGGVPASEDYSQGVALGALGQFSQAREALERSLEAAPFFEPAQACKEILQDVQEQRLDPKAAVHLFKAMAYGNHGDWGNYLAEVNRAVALNPGYAPAYQHRGNAFFELGEFEQAIAEYDQALKLNPRSASAFNNRGIAYRKIGDLDRAVSDYTRSLGINPIFALAYYNRAIAYRQKGKLDLAIEDFNRAVKINPRAAEALFNQALTCEQAGRGKEAAAAYRKFLQQARPEYVEQVAHARGRLAALEASRREPVQRAAEARRLPGGH